MRHAIDHRLQGYQPHHEGGVILPHARPTDDHELLNEDSHIGLRHLIVGRALKPLPAPEPVSVRPPCWPTGSGEWTFLDMVASRNATTWGRMDVRSFETTLGLSDIHGLEVPREMLIQLSTEGYSDLSRDPLFASVSPSPSSVFDRRPTAPKWVIDTRLRPTVHPTRRTEAADLP